jgi:hypothetical protein
MPPDIPHIVHHLPLEQLKIIWVKHKKLDKICTQIMLGLKDLQLVILWNIEILKPILQLNNLSVKIF